TGGSIGIGFAVPAAIASNVVDQLQQFGETRRGWLGVRIQTVNEEIAESLGLSRARGALIADVTRGGPAAKGGLKAGDVILSFDGRDVENMRGLPRIVARTPVGKEVDVQVLRDGKEQTLQLTIARLTEGASGDATTEENAAPAKPEEPEKRSELLGLVVTELDDASRKKFRIADDVNGVLVLEVDPESVAARKNISPGDVILEVTQKEVGNPGEITDRVAEIRSSGRKSALLLVSSSKGELRFVALPLGDE
ncbi:MAG: PDZ domain-containing protein, partial [Pseudomonadota bacterium]